MDDLCSYFMDFIARTVCMWAKNEKMKRVASRWLERRMLGNMMRILKHGGCRVELPCKTFTLRIFPASTERAELSATGFAPVNDSQSNGAEFCLSAIR